MNSESLRSQITTAVRLAETGGPVPFDELVDGMYEELKGLAHKQMAREATGHTLETTALVHEAYLKLVDSTQVGQRGRAYFFAAAARAMRQVLVDHARRRTAGKRGGGAARVELSDVQLEVDAFAVELIDLDRALQKLTTINERAARVVECRYFGGMSVEETAAALDISNRTVKADWAFARAWLFETLHQSPPADAG
jgi:RNA polymerase sigma factor (TIGR02999 family)